MLNRFNESGFPMKHIMPDLYDSWSVEETRSFLKKPREFRKRKHFAASPSIIRRTMIATIALSSSASERKWIIRTLMTNSVAVVVICTTYSNGIVTRKMVLPRGENRPERVRQDDPFCSSQYATKVKKKLLPSFINCIHTFYAWIELKWNGINNEKCAGFIALI